MIKKASLNSANLQKKKANGKQELIFKPEVIYKDSFTILTQKILNNKIEIEERRKGMPFDSYYRHICDMKEKGLRDGLIKLGWASPEERKELQEKINMLKGLTLKLSMVVAENKRLKRENEQLNIELEDTQQDLWELNNL